MDLQTHKTRSRSIMGREGQIERKHWSEVFGYFNYGECKVMQALCVGNTVLEIGSFYGKSTLCIAEVAKRVITVDTFKAHDNGVIQMEEFTTFDTFRKNIKGYHNILPLVGRSEDVIPALDIEVDVAFIDGLHEYEQVKKDSEVCFPKLRDGGVMVFHDFACYHNDVGRAVKEIRFEYCVPISNIAFVVKKGEVLWR